MLVCSFYSQFGDYMVNIDTLDSFRIYFCVKPFLLITDLNMIKEVTVKQFDKFVARMVSTIFLLTKSSI